ncbi:hypothetical protein PVAND_005805 [Polypedilum vanderplanki]|uniref:Uncharacterized protein n=1 Tax=Polypedilum vanderplanki TaxID=319348 RepID=A0A9J6C199_POLVA|nr:hypothetical protein PVAND_005805 [Polypedilum vanderplanki]
MQTCFPDQSFYTIQRVCSKRSEKNIVKLLMDATYKYKFITCEFRDISLGGCEKMLSLTLTDNGICQTNRKVAKFPHLESAFFKILADDDDNDWTMEKGYETDQDETFPIRALKRNKIGIYYVILSKEDEIVWFCIKNGRGNKVIFHLPNEIPTSLHDSQFAAFDHHKKIKINAKIFKINPEMHSYPPNIRRCYLENEKKLKFFKTYTRTLCDYECMINYTLKICGCVKFSMPHIPETKVCDLNKSKCLSEAINLWPHNNRDALNDETTCNCLEPCNIIQYSMEIDRNSAMNTKTDVYLEVSFAKHFIEEHTSYIVYNFQNFIADCGGLISVVLGFSLLSFLELIFKCVAFYVKMKRANFNQITAWNSQ